MTEELKPIGDETKPDFSATTLFAAKLAKYQTLCDKLTSTQVAALPKPGGLMQRAALRKVQLEKKKAEDLAAAKVLLEQTYEQWVLAGKPTTSVTADSDFVGVKR